MIVEREDEEDTGTGTGMDGDKTGCGCVINPTGVAVVIVAGLRSNGVPGKLGNR